MNSKSVARVIVNGAHGKMGSLAAETLHAHADFEVVGRLDQTDDLKAAIDTLKADIVVDFTAASTVYKNTLTIIEAHAKPVIGTSGLQAKEVQALQEICQQKQLGGLIVPNFSIGAVLMMHLSAISARYFNEVEILEYHHPQKQDAPSGTAVKTVELIAKARTAMPAPSKSKELIPGARGASYHDIPIHSIRLPGVIADQQVMFGNMGETLTISHHTIDRSAFMPGLIVACLHVQTIQELQYGLEQALLIQN